MTFDEIVSDFLDISEKKYRAKQVYEWIVKGASSFDEMTNLSKPFREKLSSIYEIPKVVIETKRISSDGTIKYLLKMPFGGYIESVIMKYKHGNTICISTQVGCKMGCAFCKTGELGFKRNLLPSEMIGQIQEAEKDLNSKISNIVLMGMGEPLDNYENVVKFLKMISSEDHLNIGMRHISLSTCGIVDKIYKLAEENMQLTLSISLHASGDETRKKIMKIANRWSISELIEACKYYIKKTGRRISFEYIMIDGVNDRPADAERLIKLLKGVLCHVNLIPLNGENNANLKRSSKNCIYRFKNALEAGNISATIRRTLGEDIEGACGQLRAMHIPKEV